MAKVTFVRALSHTLATAHANGPDISNLYYRGCHVVVDITAISGAGATMVVTIEGKDPVSGKYYTLLASAALNATGTTVMKIFPGATAATNLAVNDILPRTIRVTSTKGGTWAGTTCTVSVVLVP